MVIPDYYQQGLDTLKTDAAHLFALKELVAFWTFVDQRRNSIVQLLIKHSHPALRASEMEAFFERFFTSINYPNENFVSGEPSLRQQFYDVLKDVFGPFPVVQHVLLSSRSIFDEGAHLLIERVLKKHRSVILHILQSDQSPARIAMDIDAFLDPTFASLGMADVDHDERHRFFDAIVAFVERVQSHDGTPIMPSHLVDLLQEAA